MKQTTIDENMFVTEIVTLDYRTAQVFRRYDIDFCCGGKTPLGISCEMRGLNLSAVKDELEQAMRVNNLSPLLNFRKWPTAFLVNYIIYVHHAYLREALPVLQEQLERFVKGHHKKYPHLVDLLNEFKLLSQDMIPHLDHEESIVFPYILQVARAYEKREPYAALLVRTLRKPLEELMQQSQHLVHNALRKFREMTSNYTIPDDACVSHRVAFALLQELDNDLIQHFHLENNVLFPAAISMEKQLLSESDPV